MRLPNPHGHEPTRRAMRTTFIIQALVVFFIALGFGMLTRDLLADLEFQSFQAAEVVMIDTANLLAAELESTATTTGTAGPAILTSRINDIFTNARAREFSARVFQLDHTRIALSAYVTGADGIVLWDSENGKRTGMDFSKMRDVSLTLRGGYGARSSRTDPAKQGTSVLHVAAPIRHGDAIIGVVTVTVPQSTFFPFIEARIKRTVGSALLIGTGVVVLALAVFFWLLRPIRRLTAYAQAIRDGKRVALPPLGKSREAATLGAAMEEMREKLEGRAFAERYVQNLTHELKSPLAAIRGAGELLQENDLPPAQHRRFVANILQETERSESLIRQLLELARLESLPNLHAAATVPVADLLEETTGLARARAETAGVTLEVSLPIAPLPPLTGDAFALRTALSNLVENAIAYAPPGSTVTCAAASDGQAITITIRDHGPGMPDYAEARVFDHFYSLRHLHGGRKGTGLGLTFVREAATLHGGTATLANHPDGGCLATLHLPVSPSP